MEEGRARKFYRGFTEGFWGFLVVAVLLNACASTPVTYVRRMGYLESRLEKLDQEGWVELLTPAEFERARQAYHRAQDLIRDDGDPKAIVNEMSRAEVNFILAENRAKRLQGEFPQVVASRRRALARTQNSTAGTELEKIDQLLKKQVTKYKDEGAPISPSARKRLVEAYLGLAAQGADGVGRRF